MKIENELTLRARAIPREKRAALIQELREVDLHQFPKELFSHMQPDYLVEVTHGTQERGKDLVIVKDDGISRDVIGIVVKKGDMRAKTSGDVDEVVDRVTSLTKAEGGRAFEEVMSQIRQSKAHPAELKAVFAELPITKVLVVISGAISNNVRDRILRELAHVDPPKDIDWLVENFTNYYPQIFFEGKTIDFLLSTGQKPDTAA